MGLMFHCYTGDNENESSIKRMVGSLISRSHLVGIIFFSNVITGERSSSLTQCTVQICE